jgi:hypothetical protein
MRLQKLFIAAGILAIIGFFIAGVANAAPDMSEWVGKWFSYKMTQKGILFDGSKFIKGSDKNSGYFFIHSWDSDEEDFEIYIYTQDDEGWQVVTEYLHFLAGNNLGFLVLYEDDENRFISLIQGKEKKGVLSSATIKTYGGIVLKSSDDGYAAGSVVLTGKMIDASKVKVPQDVIIP